MFCHGFIFIHFATPSNVMQDVLWEKDCEKLFRSIKLNSRFLMTKMSGGISPAFYSLMKNTCEIFNFSILTIFSPVWHHKNISGVMS